MDIKQLCDYLDQYLALTAFNDYCPNGLQVAGKRNIKKIVTGVTACQALLDAAVSRQADTLLVHHGYFWKGENPCVIGRKQKHLKTLLENNINLLAYHLPLDAHSELGNNALLGKQLNFSVTDILDDGLLYVGKLKQPCLASELAQTIATQLKRQPQVITHNDKMLSTIAWCTGAAQDFIERVAPLNVDAYLSGEISERTYHQAIEYDISYFAAGHHATEVFGIKALGEHLQQKFDLEVEFIDIANPI